MKRNWFSNFEPFDVPYVFSTGVKCATPEHYYQAMKTLNKDWRKRIAECATPAEAKRMGELAPLRKRWDLRKMHFMKNALEYKFAEGTTWHKKLMESKGELIEWNYWHDNFWGSCVCKKCRLIIKPHHNHLGKLLMKIRDEYTTKCGACGNPEITDGIFVNNEKNITTRLCLICERTAELNGYIKKK